MNINASIAKIVGCGINDFVISGRDIEFDPNVLNQLVRNIGISNGLKTVCHYTTLDSGLKILQSNELKLSPLISLNDKNEQKTLSDLSGINIREKNHWMRVSYFNETFISSFSFDEDKLDMWRLYGDNGKGMAITFSIQTKISAKMIYGQVIYGDKNAEVFKKLRRILDKNGIRNIVLNGISLVAPLIKDDIWKNENEFRIVLRDHKSTEWELSKSGLIKPYRMLKISDDNGIMIQNVILGPCCPHLEANIGQLKILERQKDALWNINKSRINTYIP
jgi:hypothetical protein